MRVGSIGLRYIGLSVLASEDPITPAMGARTVEVPAGERWKIDCIHVGIYASAAVGDRTIKVEQAGLYAHVTVTPTPANMSYVYYFVPNLPVVEIDHLTTIQRAMEWLFSRELEAGMALTLQGLNLQANDTWYYYIFGRQLGE